MPRKDHRPGSFDPLALCAEEGCVCRVGTHGENHVRYYEEGDAVLGYVGTFWAVADDGEEIEIERFGLSGSIVDDPLAIASVWDYVDGLALRRGTQATRRAQ